MRWSAENPLPTSRPPRGSTRWRLDGTRYGRTRCGRFGVVAQFAVLAVVGFECEQEHSCGTGSHERRRGHLTYLMPAIGVVLVILGILAAQARLTLRNRIPAAASGQSDVAHVTFAPAGIFRIKQS